MDGTTGARRAPAPLDESTTSVPPPCHLCAGTGLRVRHLAREAGAPTSSSFACTSFGHRHHQPIWECDGCGLLVQWPRPPDTELVAAYEGVEDPTYVAESENRHHTFRRVIGRLGPPRSRRLLDVGAYCGYFLDVARDVGFCVEGLELSRWAGEIARSRGHTVHQQTLRKRADAGGRYDVVTLWDVVEHLADPRHELEAVFDLLEPGGEVWLSTIDAGSKVARLFGSRWPWLMDMHLFYFDRATLPALLTQAGFVDVEIGLYTHVISGRYLLRKLAASFRPLGPVARALQRVTPERVRVPINLGDNMILSARKPA